MNPNLTAGLDVFPSEVQIQEAKYDCPNLSFVNVGQQFSQRLLRLVLFKLHTFAGRFCDVLSLSVVLATSNLFHENNFANPLAVNVLELEGTSAAHPVKLKLAAIKISHEINS